MSGNLGIALDTAPDDLAAPAAIVNRLAQCADLLDQAADSGISSAWLGESYPTGSWSFHLPNPLLTIATLAVRRKMHMGTGVLLLGAWEPNRLASDTAMLDQLLEGRLTLGVGGGPHSLPARFGRGSGNFATMLDESLLALRRGWRQGSIRPWFQTGPPVLVGGGVVASTWRAAKYGDGLYLSTTHGIHHVRQMIAEYRSACQALGNSPGTVAINRLCLIAEDNQVAITLASKHLIRVLRRYQSMVALRREMDEQSNTAGVSDKELVEEFCLVGDPVTVAAQIEQYTDAGVTSLNLRVAPSALPTEVARQTLSYVKELHGGG